MLARMYQAGGQVGRWPASVATSICLSGSHAQDGPQSLTSRVFSSGLASYINERVVHYLLAIIDLLWQSLDQEIPDDGNYSGPSVYQPVTV